MHDLLMRALDGAAADPVSQPQIFVIAHAGGVCAVVTDQRIQSLPQLRRLWTQPFQPRYDLLHLAGFEIDTDLADPLIGLLRAFAVTHTGKLPGMFHCMPEIEDLATPDKPCGPVPDPFRTITDDDHHRVGAEPTQFAQLSIQPVEDIIGVAQTTDQKASHYRAASGRGFDSFLRQQQNACLDLAEMAFLQGRQWLSPRLSPPTAAPLHAQCPARSALERAVCRLAGYAGAAG